MIAWRKANFTFLCWFQESRPPSCYHFYYDVQCHERLTSVRHSFISSRFSDVALSSFLHCWHKKKRSMSFCSTSIWYLNQTDMNLKQVNIAHRQMSRNWLIYSHSQISIGCFHDWTLQFNRVISLRRNRFPSRLINVLGVFGSIFFRLHR